MIVYVKGWMQVGCWVVMYRLRPGRGDVDELGGGVAAGVFFDGCAVEGCGDMIDISTVS